MSCIRKSTDFGVSNAERKTLRATEAQEAMADHELAEKAGRANLVRRQTREAVEGPVLYPAPELPDDTPVEKVRLLPRIRNAMKAGGLKTVGEIREASDATSLQDLGRNSITHLRETLGLPSTDGVRPNRVKRP